MNKIILLFTLVIFYSTTLAQKSKVNKAASLNESGKIKEALETIQLTIEPDGSKSEKTIFWPKTWEVRGDIYIEIYKSENKNYKGLSGNPLDDALESYEKALELDTDGKHSDNLKIKLNMLGANYNDQGFKAYKKRKFQKALYSFEHLLKIKELPIIKEDSPEAIDTITWFNAGLAAFNGKQYGKAIDYYKKVSAYGYNKGRSFILLSSSYLALNDTTNALGALSEGYKAYPEDMDILTEMISLYIKTGQREQAFNYLEIAARQDPSNPLVFKAYFNLGAYYYNQGVEQYEKAIAIPSDENEKYKKELAKCDKWWDKALPLMQKCHELNSKDKATIETLKNLYYRLKTEDDNNFEALYKKMDQKLKNL